MGRRVFGSVFTLFALGLASVAIVPSFAGQPPLQKLPRGAGRLLPDLEYARINNKVLHLDLYLPEVMKGPVPLVIHVHGGGWSAGNYKTFPNQPYLSGGYALATVQYRLSGEATFPAAIQDVKAAVRWLRANSGKLKLDPDRFAAWGTSAGGHLVALLGTSGGVKDFDTGDNLEVSSKVQAVCDWFGPTDFLTIREHLAKTGVKFDHESATSPIGRFIGGAVQQNLDKCKLASPLTYVSKQSPPFLIVHGDKDALVPVAQSRELETALKNAGVEVTVMVLPGAGHGGKEFVEGPVQSKMLEFLDQHFKKKQQSVSGH